MIRMIAKSVVNWQYLVQSLKGFTGVDLSLDFAAANAHRLTHYITFLEKFTGRSFDHNLKMISCAFVITTDTYDLLDLLVHTELNIVSRPTKGDGHICIVSGTLLQWRHAVVYACNEDAETECRKTFNRIFAIFEEEGVKSLWDNYVWKTLSDGTGSLIERTV